MSADPSYGFESAESSLARARVQRSRYSVTGEGGFRGDAMDPVYALLDRKEAAAS